MSFYTFIKTQLIDIVDSYKKYFLRTYGITLTFTIFCFAIIAICLKFTDFDKINTPKQISLLSYFITRYSFGDTYSIIDLSKTIFIFFVSLFALGIIRFPSTERYNEIPYKKFSKGITLSDIISLTIAFLASAGIDFFLFKTDSFFSSQIQSQSTLAYIHNLIFHLRIYAPLILFAFTIRLLYKKEKLKISFKTILFLYISLWICNEVSFEFMIWMRTHIFNFIFLLFPNSKNIFVVESLLGIPLIASFFLGYYSMMTVPLKDNEKEIN